MSKLVRDNIPQIMQAKGLKARSHIATREEYQQKLCEKLKEEVEEYLLDENPEELADILEVIAVICDEKGITKGAIEKIRLEKREKRGGFTKKIILES